MARHNEAGRAGEAIAVDFLQRKGYNILAVNWRCGRKEVDIIAMLGSLGVFIEVKTRAYSYVAYPEEFVTQRKRDNLKFAAGAYCRLNPAIRDYRFDIISIVLSGGYLQEIFHFEEAF